MAYRVIMIENEVCIKVKLNNLIISKGSEKDVWIPLEDISVIVMDNLTTTITVRTLTTFAEYGIELVISDTTHQPVGIYGALVNHSRATKVQLKQINYFTEQNKDHLWIEIVQQKIVNQCQVLELLEKDKFAYSKMYDYMEQIQPGDITNREAHTAKIYFNTLMGTTFSRGNEDILLNSGLDYGYAIIRSYLSRVCVGYGLNPQIGIHHKNEYNRFNLCDDLIEPIRPIVDYYVYQLLQEEEYFSSEHRRKIVNILNHKIKYQNKKMYICNMLETYVEQVASLVMGKRDSICFPFVVDYIGQEDEI